MKPSKQPPSPSSVKQALLGVYGIVGVTISTFGPFKVPFAESHAKDYWRHALMGLLLIIALFAGIISLAIYMFDANYFKSQMVDYVKTHHQRDLTLEGDIKVTFFPKLGLDSGKMTLSQRNSNKNFAAIDNVRFYIAWWPMLQKQLQIESVALDGMHTNIIRYKNGSSNLDDLFTSEGTLGNIKFEIDSIKINNSSANLQDEISDIHFSLHNLNIETGKLADATPAFITANFRLESSKPHVDSKVKLNSHILFDLQKNHYEFSNFEGEMEGEAAGLNNLALNFQGTLNNYPVEERLLLDKFSISAKGKIENRRLEAKLDIPKFQAIKNEISGSAIALNATLLQDDENLTAAMQLPVFNIKENKLLAENMTANFDLFMPGKTLQGKLNSPLNLDLKTNQIQLSALAGNLNFSHPLLRNKLSANFNGEMQGNFTEQSLKMDFKTKIDDSNIIGSVGVQDFIHPAYTFDVGTNTLDLDRYLTIDWSKRLQDDALAFDFSYLKTLNLRGKFRSNELKFAKLKTSNFVAEIRNEQSTLSIDPISANLYNGTTSGSLSIAANEIPAISFKHKLSGVQLNDLFSDLIPGEAKFTGKGNLTLALNATGENMGTVRRTLNGNISLALGRGTLAGINLAETLVANKNQLGIIDAELNQPAKFTDTTLFTELKSTFDINEGKAHSSDLLLKLALFSSNGEGDINLETGELVYQFNTTVAPALKRSSHGEIAELKGISIPMQLNGHYLTPTIKMSFGAASGGNLAKLLEKNQVKPEPVVTKPAKPATLRSTK
jgi:AsmA protein